MNNIYEIKKTLSEYFNAPVTPERLSEPAGSKSIRTAKKYGICIAAKIGYKAADIAAAFGFANSKSASQAISAVKKEYRENLQFREAVEMIATRLDPDLKLD